MTLEWMSQHSVSPALASHRSVLLPESGDTADARQGLPLTPSSMAPATLAARIVEKGWRTQSALLR